VVVKRRLYLVLLFFVVVVATIMIAFIIRKDTATEYKGTLVHRYSQEAAV
jgi:hypothetical protein